MGWRERLAKFAGGERGVRYEVTSELENARAGLLRQACWMRLHAQQAPNQLNRDELVRLADEDDAHAERLAEALRALGAGPSQAPGTPPPAGALNHWRRLVQDLELHRGAMRRLREVSFHFSETLPETAKLFDQLCVGEQAHAERLRDLIARTDPQALN